MTADQDLSARLPCGCCGAMQPLSAYANDPVVMVITFADHLAAVQAAKDAADAHLSEVLLTMTMQHAEAVKDAVENAVKAERDACAKRIDNEVKVARMRGPQHVPVLTALAAAIRSRGVAG